MEDLDMKHFLRYKVISAFMLIGLSVLLLGCSQKNIAVEEIFPEAIENMKSLNSYVSSVGVTFTGEEENSGQITMNAVITYHKEPFAYANIQEINNYGEGSDNPLEKLYLNLLVKEGSIYTSTSITGLWVDKTDPELLKEIEDNAHIFQGFEADQFEDLKLVSVSKNKATLEGLARESTFLQSLLSSFDTSISGKVEIIIDMDQNYMESFTYYPEIQGESSEKNKINIKTKSFNAAPEVEIPEEAL